MLTKQQFYSRNALRWHAHHNPKLRHSNDGIKGHQIRCVSLVHDFVIRPTCTLINSTRWHDQEEVILGDWPFTAKRDFPRVDDAYLSAKRVIVDCYNIPQPANDWEKQVIKFVDSLDAYEWVIEHAPEELDTPDWHDAATHLFCECDDLGFDVDLLQYKMGD